MVVSTIALGAFQGAAKAVVENALKLTGISDRLEKAREQRRATKALQQALFRAFRNFSQRLPQYVSDGFDQKFLEHEGAPVLARFLVRDGQVNPTDLAEALAKRLRARPGDQRPVVHVRDIEPVASEFLTLLTHELKAERDLRNLINDRTLEQTSSAIIALSRQLGADRATEGTLRDYLYWVKGRNSYIDARGIAQTERPFQLKLDEVYVSLSARRDEALSPSDRRQLEQELHELEEKAASAALPAAEVENRRELILSRFRRSTNSLPAQDRMDDSLELEAVVRDNDRLVILGDPGCGKSTLLRYLALKHAEAHLGEDLGPDSPPVSARLPILVRIAEYAENNHWRNMSLTDFIPRYCEIHECPRPGLRDLLDTHLQAGTCLVLLDGLDEIASADQRQGVVQQIEDFIRRHGRAPNRFIVTCRIAGYEGSQLSEPCAHYIVREMDEPQVHRFLDRWCRAIEIFETPNLPFEVRESKAQREVGGIIAAISESAGIRKLAGNPLLLTILSQIHRTEAQLPPRRVELYHRAAETLAHAWRRAQGVEVSPLLNDEFLTPLLSKLAYWMHENKPTGIATEQEIYGVLGEGWASIRDLPWSPDAMNPAILAEVRTFLQAVREHAGLLVERAPQRYGFFIHGTFEEYYAARHLVELSQPRARLIRQHLHDARWEEPILLGLGFVGLQSSAEVTKLIETAILAEGDESRTLGFTSSAHEELLGRDFLFALRCLGDAIPIQLRVARRLIAQLISERLEESGRARFAHYRVMLDKILAALVGSSAENDVTSRLGDILRGAELPDSKRLTAVELLGPFVTSSQIATAALLWAVHDDPEAVVRLRAVQVLGFAKVATLPAIKGLLQALLEDADRNTRAAAADALGTAGDATPTVTNGLLRALRDPDSRVRYSAAIALANLSENSPAVVVELQKVIHGLDPLVRAPAAAALAYLEQYSPIVIEELQKALHEPDPLECCVAGALLLESDKVPVDTIEVLTKVLLYNTDPDIRSDAAAALGRAKSNAPQAVRALAGAAHDTEAEVRLAASDSLMELAEESPDAMRAVLEALSDIDSEVQYYARRALRNVKTATPPVIDVLLGAVHEANVVVCSEAAFVLGNVKMASAPVIESLLHSLDDTEGRSRLCFTAAAALFQLAAASPTVSPTVIEGLQKVLQKPKPVMRAGAAAAGLVALGQDSPEAVEALLAVLRDSDTDNTDTGAHRNAVAVLDGVKEITPEVTEALFEALRSPATTVRYEAANVLSDLGKESPAIIEVLVDGAANASDWQTRRDCLDCLAQVTVRDERVIDGIWRALLDTDNDVRHASAAAIARLALRFSDKKEAVTERLIGALSAEEYALRDNIEELPGQDYAYEALVRIISGEIDELA